jgi:6-phosphogluconate dehydrogenase
MMQALAEGFALLEAAPEFGLDAAAIAECWRHGSVIRSWLLDLTAEALADPAALGGVAPRVEDSGEGRWAVVEGVERGVPTPVISLALAARFASRGGDDLAHRLLALMRRGFGGHPTYKPD